MNQMCKVCDEPAAGFHFGAFTCEGCKSFFGRTYNNLGSISECKNGGNCVINKKNRTSCKACRLKKCLMVGMSKSGSRYGRRSNWFKIHCLLQNGANPNQSGDVATAALSPFGPAFLPGFLPQAQGQQAQGQQAAAAVVAAASVYASKDTKDSDPPRQFPDNDQIKPSHRDDIALQNQLRMIAWQQENNRLYANGQQQRASSEPSRDTVSPPLRKRRSLEPRQKQQQEQREEELRHHHRHQQQQQQQQVKPTSSPNYSMNYMQKDVVIPNNVTEVFRPFLSNCKALSEERSDCGSSPNDNGTDRLQESESRCNSAQSYSNSKRTSPDQYFPARKINATVTLTTTGYISYPQLGFIYPQANLVTPATTLRTQRGGDVPLANPCIGGLAVEQNEPIDLSIRSSRSSTRSNNLTENEDNDEDDNDFNEKDDSSNSGSSINGETKRKGKPLDLTLTVKSSSLPFML